MKKEFEKIITNHLSNKEKVGGKIHLILNNTLHRKLTLNEYDTLVNLISDFGVDVFDNKDIQKYLTDTK